MINQKEFFETPTFAPEILEYLQQRHLSLNNDYRMPPPQSNFSESCHYVYNEIANLCRKYGYEPKLFRVRGKKLAGEVNTKSLIPKRYQGRVVWGGHLVCVVGNTVLDPLVGIPLSMEEYAETVFENPVDLREVNWESPQT